MEYREERKTILVLDMLDLTTGREECIYHIDLPLLWAHGVLWTLWKLNLFTMRFANSE